MASPEGAIDRASPVPFYFQLAELLESWEDPGLDESVDEELGAYMAQRKRELDE